MLVPALNVWVAWLGMVQLCLLPCTFFSEGCSMPSVAQWHCSNPPVHHIPPSFCFLLTKCWCPLCAAHPKGKGFWRSLSHCRWHHSCLPASNTQIQEPRAFYTQVGQDCFWMADMGRKGQLPLMQSHACLHIVLLVLGHFQSQGFFSCGSHMGHWQWPWRLARDGFAAFLLHRQGRIPDRGQRLHRQPVSRHHLCAQHPEPLLQYRVPQMGGGLEAG